MGTGGLGPGSGSPGSEGHGRAQGSHAQTLNAAVRRAERTRPPDRGPHGVLRARWARWLELGSSLAMGGLFHPPLDSWQVEEKRGVEPDRRNDGVAERRSASRCGSGQAGLNEAGHPGRPGRD